MSIKAKKKRKPSLTTTTGKHVRFPTDLARWLDTYAMEQGFTSGPDLVRQIVREYKQRTESVA